jgi:Protein of unknown function (DUF3830)
MKDFIISTPDNQSIHFRLYVDAPLTIAAFANALPFSAIFFHARISGEEIWTAEGPGLDVIQENASVFAEPGEIVIGQVKPGRNKISNCIGIFYGDGKLLDCGNIFAKVFEEDLPLLKSLGDKIWKQGAQELAFEKCK